MKKITAIMLISFLALSSVLAWPFSSGNTSAVVPLSSTLLSAQETNSTNTAENGSEGQSTTSGTTSKLLAEIEAGLAEMDAGHAIVADAAAAYEGEIAKAKKLAFFGKLNGQWNGGLQVGVGLSAGMIIASEYIFELGAMKKDILTFNNYGKPEAYAVTFSIGYIF